MRLQLSDIKLLLNEFRNEFIEKYFIVARKERVRNADTGSYLITYYKCKMCGIITSCPIDHLWEKVSEPYKNELLKNFRKYFTRI